MASGKLGSAVLTASTPTVVYTVPSGVTATANIRVVNPTGTAAQVSVSIGAASPASQDMYEPTQVLAPGGVLLDTGEPIKTGENVVVTSSVSGVVVRVSGFEGAQ